MESQILWIILLTLTPFFELRASIPYGILVAKMQWWWVFLIAVITNAILGPVLYILIDKVLHVFLKIKSLDKIYSKYVEKTQRKIHPYVEKYGEYGVALFIGVPLPGSGSYSGALGSYILGLDFKKFTIANILGVLIAGIIVTIISVAGNGTLSFFLKTI